MSRQKLTAMGINYRKWQWICHIFRKYWSFLSQVPCVRSTFSHRIECVTKVCFSHILISIIIHKPYLKRPARLYPVIEPSRGKKIKERFECVIHTVLSVPMLRVIVTVQRLFSKLGAL